MIILPIKKKWFDMIKSGEKKEEYREIKRYWITRFNNKGILSKYNPHTIIFRNGYGKNRPSLQCKVNVRVGQGKEKWGAKKRKRVLRFRNFGGNVMTDYEQIVISAVRYALGRMTYIVELTVNYVLQQIEDNKLSDRCLDIIAEDIRSARTLGMECDKVLWLKLLDRIEEVV